MLRNRKEAVFEVFAERIMASEGLDLRPYRDTRDIVTIGYGHNLEIDGREVTLVNGAITKEKAVELFWEDLENAYKQARFYVPGFSKQCVTRQGVLTDMAFQMGGKGLSSFVRMIAAIQLGDYDEAAAEILDSKYAVNHPNRAGANAEMMRRGA